MRYLIEIINQLGLLEAVRQVNPGKLAEILANADRQPTRHMVVHLMPDDEIEDGDRSLGSRYTGPFSDGRFLGVSFYNSNFTPGITIHHHWIDYNPTECEIVGECSNEHAPDCDGWDCECDLDCSCDSCIYGEGYCSAHNEHH